ncbi:MAG: recombinase zinc beta ribbon domain-containing protein [Parvibaculales bacterium]
MPVNENQGNNQQHIQSAQENPPKQNSSPIFLSGVLKCGQCGSGMTLVTGKSGQYRYYKCTNQKHKTLESCDTPNIPMDKLDSQVRERLSERVFTPRRVRNIMSKLRKQINAQDQGDKALMLEIKQKLLETNQALENLMQSIEAGLFDFNDETLKNRVQKLKARKEELLIQQSGIKRRQNLLPQTINNAQVDAFCQALQNKFNDPASGFGKGYLNFLVDEVRIEKDQAVMKGRNRALAEFVSALNPENSAVSVPTSISVWRTGEDSNSRPLDS